MDYEEGKMHIKQKDPNTLKIEQLEADKVLLSDTLDYILTELIPSLTPNNP